MSDPMVQGLAEIVLWVRDMERALAFYFGLFGLRVISPDGVAIKFLEVGRGADGVPEMIVLVPHPEPAGDFPRVKAQRVLHHLALRVARSSFDELRTRLEAAGLATRDGKHPVLQHVRTFYVDDPDGNEVEVIGPE